MCKYEKGKFLKFTFLTYLINDFKCTIPTTLTFG